jgi:hypothetical protein
MGITKPSSEQKKQCDKEKPQMAQIVKNQYNPHAKPIPHDLIFPS